MNKFSYLKAPNVDYIDSLLTQYLEDPSSLDESWQHFFEGMELGREEAATNLQTIYIEKPAATSNASAVPQANSPSQTSLSQSSPFSQEAKVVDLILAYRQRGHLLAHLNPLLTAGPSGHPLLELNHFGLSPSDLDTTFRAGRLIGLEDTKLKDIIAELRRTYCRTIGVEYTHIQDMEPLLWLQKSMESTRNTPQLGPEQKKRILNKLTQAEGFEQFLHTRYIGAKRFSVEGGEAMIAALDYAIDKAGQLGWVDLVVGMAHRGRLNVLTNIFGKKFEVIFSEFEGNYNVSTGEGDVKYHMGYSADVVASNGQKLHLSLLPNPSHLEAVNPVVEGAVRAKQDQKKDTQRQMVLPVLIHGDAAFAGQGIIYETFQLSKLDGYTTGGTLHFVINNQVGFTTNPTDSRSTPYATDVAKMLESPVFHVNGDDPEAVIHVTSLAMEFIRKFKKDVVIDIICYRKYGHNEGDEPSYTQPLMYKTIKEHLTPRAVYAKRLAAEGTISESDSAQVLSQFQQQLMQAQAVAKTEAPIPTISVFEGAWKGLRSSTTDDFGQPVTTAVSAEQLKELGKAITTFPSTVKVHPKLEKIFETRQKMMVDGAGIDWGMGEALAFASLLSEGTSIRITGQDVERGTFSHRQSVVNDFETGTKYCSLNHLKPNQGTFNVHNSCLSEYAVLGFEFGYSLAEPRSLVIWEAQFGDFGNGAQIIIDQFLAASESKWQRMSGLTLLLPHGYEGQGPEHSSARLERFLQLCGRNNMTVCNLTTPAQIFHALRRQMKRPFRMPLVVMSPKSLLRHPLAVSKLEEFSAGRFQEVIGDNIGMQSVTRVLLCTGKIYYELLAERQKQGRQDVAIVRVEELYPWPKTQIENILSQYPQLKEIFWVQEEPRNMGAWRAMLENLTELVRPGQTLKYAGRDVAAAPAVGSPKRHDKEQKAIIETCFKGE